MNRQTGRAIRAIVPVHIFGHPVDMAPLLAVAAKYGLVVVEDATESLGSTWQGQACGTFGHSAVLSFNGNKIITTGGGGMILTDDDEYARRARHFTTTAKKSHAWSFDHDEVGYNYRLPNINAALGCAQMEKLPALVAAKRRLAERYLEMFDGVSRCARSTASRRARAATTGSTRWCSTANLPASATGCSGELHAHGVRSRPLWTPMHLLPMYRDCPRSRLTVAEDMHARCINLPSSPFLARERELRTVDAPAGFLHHSQHDAVVEISGVAHRFRRRDRAERSARRGRLFAGRRFLSLHAEGRCGRGRSSRGSAKRGAPTSSCAAACSEASTAISRCG